MADPNYVDYSNYRRSSDTQAPPRIHLTGAEATDERHTMYSEATATDRDQEYRQHTFNASTEEGDPSFRTATPNLESEAQSEVDAADVPESAAIRPTRQAAYVEDYVPAEHYHYGTAPDPRQEYYTTQDQYATAGPASVPQAYQFSGQTLAVPSPYVGRSQQQDNGKPRARRVAPPSIPKEEIDGMYDPPVIHGHPIPEYGEPTTGGKILHWINQISSFMITATSLNIIIGMSLIWAIWPFKKKPPPRAKVSKESELRITGERWSTRTEYYAEYWGYKVETHEVESEDGFILKMFHLISPKHTHYGQPVLVMHGILCNSSCFCMNEENSLPFWLMEQGYDVWLGNIRTNYRMGHKHWSKHDPRFWAWGVPEIGVYDCPAMVEFVYEATGRKVAYIGHSQGTGTMFVALSRGMRPDIGEKMSCFVALGPAVYAGPTLSKFPFSLMQMLTPRSTWKLAFGSEKFIPLLGMFADYMPAMVFGFFSLKVFNFIFDFHDHNWHSRQIVKFFRATPVHNSAELLHYYMDVLAKHGCIFDESITTPWFPKSFPPLTIIYGDIDTLVVGPPLVERIRKYEPNVNLVHVVECKGYEHLDMVWGVNCVKDCFPQIRDTIERTSEPV